MALIRVIVIPLTFAGFLASCTHWASVKPPWAEAVAESQPDKVRVTLRDESKSVVFSPTVDGEAVLGQVETWEGVNGRWALTMAEYAAPLADVENVERRRVSAVNTVLLSLGLLMTAGFVAVVIVCANDDYWC